MTLSIRIATAADADSLADVAAATFPLACPPHTTAEAIAHFIAAHLSRERFTGYLADPDRILLLAEDDERQDAVGYAMLAFGEPADADVAATISHRPTVELSKFYTRADAHGTGVAAALMAATIAAAAGRDAVGAWLGVNQVNARAIRFYGKSGFERVGTKRFLVGERYEDDFVLERPLA